MTPISWTRIAWLAALVSLGAAGAIRWTTGSTLTASELTVMSPEERLEAKYRAEQEARYPAGFHIRETGVNAEIAALPQGHPWAGKYYFGDGLGLNINLSLAPKSGGVATLTGCLGLYKADVADIESTARGTLSLKFANAKDKMGPTFPQEVLPVHWGKRHYLVPTDQLSDFANAINLGSEPRDSPSGFFLLREGDQEKPAVGLPDLPAAYLSWIRTEPTQFTVDKVKTIHADGGKSFCDRKMGLRFPRRADDDLRPGMDLQQLDHGGYGRATVTRVDERSFEAEIDDYSSSSCDIEQDLPKAGWRFTTGAYAAAALVKDHP
jgi:hypothetical protein